MARAALNKTALKQEQDHLSLYQQYLPSLDLKRQQFLGLVKAEENQLRLNQEALARTLTGAADLLPFLANREINLKGLLIVQGLEIRRQNQLGVSLPRLTAITFSEPAYTADQKPLWVDGVLELLKEVCRLSCEHQVRKQRLALLRAELKTITQRVNLFDQVLIPAARQTIREIGIALADREKAEVVRAKIAKKKRQQRGA